MTKKDRLEIYESFFHQINMHCLMMNQEKINEAVRLIDSWSYCHRVGNGVNSDNEQKRIVERVISKMKDFT